MASPRVCVLRAPGTNCDVETAFAFETCGGTPERLHLFRLLEQPALLDDFQIVCIPGGFSYGDDIGAGVIFSRQLQGRLGEAIGRFLQADKLMLGICNGFQVLTEAGLLPGALQKNRGLRFLCTTVGVRVCATRSALTGGCDRGAILRLPVNHFEGNYICDRSTLDQLRAEDRIILRYTENPNGSVDDIAGISNHEGNVVGLMPHPERACDELTGATDGMALLRGLIAAAARPGGADRPAASLTA